MTLFLKAVAAELIKAIICSCIDYLRHCFINKWLMIGQRSPAIFNCFIWPLNPDIDTAGVYGTSNESSPTSSTSFHQSAAARFCIVIIFKLGHHP